MFGIILGMAIYEPV